MATALEHTAQWNDILRLKDELPLRELASRFSTTPGAISAAFKRTGTHRSPFGVQARMDSLPPEPGEESAEGLTPEQARALRNIRPGSKDALIVRHIAKLGIRPDAEVAREAGVSVRTIASFRARHNIGGYKGPRRSDGAGSRRRSRIDPFAHLLGVVPDRVVAERAGVSLNAVRNYRVKRNIPAARRGGVTSAPQAQAQAQAPQAAQAAQPAQEDTTPAPAIASLPESFAPEGGTSAWRAVWLRAAGKSDGVILAADMATAVEKAGNLYADAQLVEITLVGNVVGVAT